MKKLNFDFPRNGNSQKWRGKSGQKPRGLILLLEPSKVANLLERV